MTETETKYQRAVWSPPVRHVLSARRRTQGDTVGTTGEICLNTLNGTCLSPFGNYGLGTTIATTVATGFCTGSTTCSLPVTVVS